MKNLLKQSSVAVLSLALIGAGMPAVTHAGIVDTATVVQATQRAAHLATIRAGLERSDVRAKMLELGVDPSKVDLRLSMLSDAELARLAGQMDELPAGGDALAVIGAVFLVLIILELVGVIDIFKR